MPGSATSVALRMVRSLLTQFRPEPAGVLKEDLQMLTLDAVRSVAAGLVLAGAAFNAHGQVADGDSPDTRELVALVNDAASLVQTRGETAFATFRVAGSRWRQKETYIFVLGREGNMLVHLDPSMEGKNQLGLRDVNGKPIIRGLIDAATLLPAKPEGWYHYQWPVPGGLLPRWKSSYVRQVTAPSGKSYIVGSGVYNDRMERSFVVNQVRDAVELIEKQGEAAFPVFRDPTSRFASLGTPISSWSAEWRRSHQPGFRTARDTTTSS
jgi:hypothetical protein